MSENEQDEIKRLRAWIRDLQSGLFVNCVYCGYRYGPAWCEECEGTGHIDSYLPGRCKTELECSVCKGTGRHTPVALADVLKEHVAVCPEHPMSKMRDALKDIWKAARDAEKNMPQQSEWQDYTIIRIREIAEEALNG